MLLFYYAVYNESRKCKTWGSLTPYYTDDELNQLIDEIELKWGIAFISNDEKKSEFRCIKFCVGLPS